MSIAKREIEAAVFNAEYFTPREPSYSNCFSSQSTSLQVLPQTMQQNFLPTSIAQPTNNDEQSDYPSINLS